MAVALRISSEAFPAISLSQVIQAVVPLTDGLTKPLNCFQGTPPTILKNWLYNNLSLLVLSTLPVKTHEDQCWGGREGPHSPSALQKEGVSCQALPDRKHHRSSGLSENLRSGSATAVSRGRRRWEGAVPKVMALEFGPAILEVTSGPAFCHAKAFSGSILLFQCIRQYFLHFFTMEKSKNSTACYLHFYMKMSTKETFCILCCHLKASRMLSLHPKPSRIKL